MNLELKPQCGVTEIIRLPLQQHYHSQQIAVGGGWALRDFVCPDD